MKTTRTRPIRKTGEWVSYRRIDLNKHEIEGRGVLRFMLDQGVSPKVKPFLLTQGHRAVHAREAKLLSVSDTTFIEIARKRGLIVVTTDAGLVKKALQQKTPFSASITLRLPNPTADEQIAALNQLFKETAVEKIRSSTIVLEKDHRHRLSISVKQPDVQAKKS